MYIITPSYNSVSILCLCICLFHYALYIFFYALSAPSMHRVLFAFNKVFRKSSLILMKEQVSRLAKSDASNIFSYFVSFGYTGERLILGLRRKDWILRAFNLLLAVKSLWPQKQVLGGQIGETKIDADF